MRKVNCLTAFKLALGDVTWGLIPGVSEAQMVGYTVKHPVHLFSNIGV